MKNKKKWMALAVMMLIASMSLCACRKDDVSAENTSGYEVTESSGKESLESASDEVTESSKEDNEESSVVEETDKTTETIESTENRETEESAEATKESAESTKESVAPTKEQESAKPSKEGSKPSSEETKPSVSAPSAEQTKPSQETSKPSASTPTVEQTTPSVEQTPSTPAVHTCNYGSGSVTKAASCKEEGVKTYTCSCGASKTESIAKTGHNYVTDSKAATCDADGYEKTACSACGDVKSEKTLAATGHSLYEWWFHEPDCTYPGDLHYNKCHNCDYKEELPRGALGHKEDAGTEMRGGNCTDKSLLAFHCIRCGCKMYEAEGSTVPDNHYWCYDEEEQEWYCAYGCGSVK